MTRFVASASVAIATAGLVAGVLLLRGGDPRWVFDVLGRLGEPLYSIWYAWLLVAPVVLVGCAFVVRRSPWPWVLAVTAHLAGLAAGAARVDHWLPAWGWPALLLVVGVGLWSVAEALSLPARSGSRGDGSS